uniref:Uncharacterized protein n=1 Tax=Timema genevievae TaxID=629358 RepID=A0A7R9JUW5_TIMGE|nr:unnamed protein product [Timema genevievae]
MFLQCNYSSPMASLVLTDSSQLTSDSQHLGLGYGSPTFNKRGYYRFSLGDRDKVIMNRRSEYASA